MTPSRQRAEPTPSAIHYSPEAEKAVLASLLTFPEETFDDVSDSLVSADFFVPAHQEIFRAIFMIHSRRNAVDIMTVNQWLVDRKLGEAIGGSGGAVGFLAELAASLVTHLNVSTYIKIVKDKSLLRQSTKAALGILRDAEENADDAEGVLDRAEAAVTAIGASRQEKDEPYSQTAQSALTEALERSINGRPMDGLSTGFPELDATIGKMRPGNNIIIAARPGVGKSALAMTIAKEVLQRGDPVHFFSFEMDRKAIIFRMAAMLAGIAAKSIREGTMSDHAIANLQFVRQQIEDWPLTITDASLDMQHIRSKARQVHRKTGTKLIVIDYFGLIENPGVKSSENRTALSNNSKSIKRLAREIGVPILNLCQLNRDFEDRPTLKNLRDCGDLEQDADVVIFPHATGDKEGPTVGYDLIVAKQRDGPTGDVRVWFEPWRTMFRPRN